MKNNKVILLLFVTFLLVIVGILPFVYKNKQVTGTKAVESPICPNEPLLTVDRLLENKESVKNIYNKADALGRELFHLANQSPLPPGTKESEAATAAKIDLLSARKKYLTALVRVSPQQALKLFSPAQMMKMNKNSADDCIERSVSLTGTIEAITTDAKDIKNSRTLYYLLTSDNKYSLNIAYDKLQILPNKKTVVNGIRIGNDIVVDSRIRNSLQQTETVLSDTIGTQRLVVLLVNFTNTPLPSVTKQTVNDIIFNTTNSFYQEVSYGQTALSGTVYDWYQVPIPATCEIYSVLSSALQNSPSVDFTQFDRIVVIAPMGPACPFSGISTGGKITVNTPQGNRNMSVAWIPSDVVNTSDFGIGVFEHELGHSYGLGHAHSLQCPTTDRLSPDCVFYEYGDPYNVMGSIDRHGHFSATQKSVLAWLPSSQITNVLTAGDYSITPLETQGGVKGIHIRRSVDPSFGFLSAEYRQPIGLDAGLIRVSQTDVFNGALMHIGLESTTLIDPSPTGNTNTDALLLGNTYVDPETGSRLTLLEKNSTSLKLNVIPGRTDFEGPVLNIQKPAPDYQAHGIMRITGSASDPSGISKIEVVLRIGYTDTVVGSYTTPSFQLDLDTTHFPNGPLIMYVYGYDNAGAQWNSANNVTMENFIFEIKNTDDKTPPTISIVSPAANAVLSSSIVNVTTTVNDNVGIHYVTFYRDQETKAYIVTTEAPFGTGTEAQNFPFPDGQHSIKAYSYDFVGNKSAASTVTFTVQTHPITPSVTPVPTPGIVNGSFETIDSKLRPVGWSVQNLVKQDKTVTNPKHGGSRSIMLTAVATGKKAKIVEQTITNTVLPAGTTFTFSGWSKIDKKIAKKQLKVQVIAINTDGTKTSYTLPFDISSTKWQNKSKSISLVKSANSLVANITYSSTLSPVYIDDLQWVTPSVTNSFAEADSAGE